MWQPEPGWERLPTGPSSAGAWLVRSGGRAVVVKRHAAPTDHDPPALHDSTHPAYWRRAVDVAVSGVVDETRGLRAPATLEVVEDAEGATVTTAWVEPTSNDAAFMARSLGRFTTNPVPQARWLARGQLGARLAEVERRGGWATLSRTPVADVADLLWRRRASVQAHLDTLPQVLQHGDPVPGNLPGRLDDDVLAVDWSSVGTGPLGADLGYLALNVRDAFEPLVEAYVDGTEWADGRGAPVEDITYAARVTVAYTVLTRVDWALTRVAPGEGALAGKYRHPSVAPYIRAMQRHFPQVEALLTTL